MSETKTICENILSMLSGEHVIIKACYIECV